MASGRFQWTPEAIQRLRENPNTKRAYLADLLGCTEWAVSAKRAEIRRAEHGGRQPSISRKYQALAREADKRRVRRMMELAERIGQLKRQKERAA
jgi:predicted transcriptional regulator